MAGVLVLVLLAFVTLLAARGVVQETDDYLNEDTPAGVVHDAFIARQRGDMERFKRYFTRRVWEESRLDRFPSPPQPSDIVTRLQIRNVRVEGDRAWVDITITRFQARSPLSREEWSTNYTLPLVREDGQWRIDQFFFWP